MNAGARTLTSLLLLSTLLSLPLASRQGRMARRPPPASTVHRISFEPNETDPNGNTLGDYGFGLAIPDGFFGLNWTLGNDWRVGTLANFPAAWDPTGFANGIADGMAAAWGTFSYIVSQGNPIVFYNVWLNPVWREGVTIHVRAWLNDAVVLDETLTGLNATTPGTLFEVPDGILVDKLLFSSSGGTLADFGNGLTSFDNAAFTIDDFTFSATPEPTSLALLGTGLVGLAYFNRRRRRQGLAADT